MKQYILPLLCVLFALSSCHDDWHRSPMQDVLPVVTVTNNIVISSQAHSLRCAILIDRYMHASLADQIEMEKEELKGYYIRLKDDTCVVSNDYARYIFIADGNRLNTFGAKWESYMYWLYQDQLLCEMKIENTDDNKYTLATKEVSFTIEDNDILYYVPDNTMTATYSRVEKSGAEIDNIFIEGSGTYREVDSNLGELSVEYNLPKGLNYYNYLNSYKPYYGVGTRKYSGGEEECWGTLWSFFDGALYGGVVDMRVNNVMGYDGLEETVKATYGDYYSNLVEIEYKGKRAVYNNF